MNLKRILSCCFLSTLISTPSLAAVKIQLEDGTQFTFGGYVKADFRYVSGDIGYQDIWFGNETAGTGPNADISALNFSIRESRIFFQVAKEGWMGRVEMDFLGGEGNQVISNSGNPRVRHAFVKNDTWLFGQTWTTFMPLHALAEAVQFGGANVAQVLIRQTQARYTMGNFMFAIELPETVGDGDVGLSAPAVGVTGTQQDTDENFPDIILRYDHKADWGVLSAATLIRQIDPGEGTAADDLGVAFNIAGKFGVGARDDFKFEINLGEGGRYVGAAFAPDISTADANGTPLATNEILETTSIKLSYRHFWNDQLRSTVYFGQSETDDVIVGNVLVAGAGRERGQFAVNLIKQLNPKMWVGGEIGQFYIKDQNQGAADDDLDSNFLQIATKYVF